MSQVLKQSDASKTNSGSWKKESFLSDQVILFTFEKELVKAEIKPEPPKVIAPKIVPERKPEADVLPLKTVSVPQPVPRSEPYQPTSTFTAASPLPAPASGSTGFFKAKDNAALYQLGNTYSDDLKRGRRHFSFAHVDSGDTQKKTIFGVASFFQHFEKLDVLIITPTMNDSFFSRFKTPVLRQVVRTKAIPGVSYTIHAQDGMSFLEWDELIQCGLRKKDSLENIVKAMAEDYDIILYDLPALGENKKNFEVFISLIKQMESVSLVVNLKKDTFSRLRELRKCFVDYKVEVKGVILSQVG